MTANGCERAISAGAVVALHAGLLWAMLHAHSVPPSIVPGASLSTFDVAPPPAPPVVEHRPRPSLTRRRPSGRAGVLAERSAIVAPAAVIPPPVVQVASTTPQEGAAAIGGTATADSGTGAGSGGFGAGTDGSGDGAGGTRARLIAGVITPRDYPKAARAARTIGSVTVAFEVGVDGRVHDCSVVETSGSATLDTVTCRLIEARFRYAPALSAGGAPVSERRGWRQRWWLE